MRKVLLSALAVSMLCGAANAADLLDPPVVVVDEAMFDWTGLYVGVQGGYAWGSVRTDEAFCVIVDDCGFPGSRYFAEPDLAGWKIGGHIGYNQQFGTFVLGAESDINWTGITGEAPFEFYDAEVDEVFEGRPGETSSLDLLWEGSTRVKLGVAFDRFMPYVTGGIAYGQGELNDHRIFGPEEDPNELDFTHPLNFIGYTVGIGGAYAMADNIILRGEARYTEYGETRSTDQVPGDGENIIVTGPKLFSVEGGVSFKF